MAAGCWPLLKVMKTTTTPSDSDLLRRMMDGDESAFTEVYRRRQPGLYRFALQMSGSEALAEDVTQEVFMVLMREAGNYNPDKGSLASYLYGVARNLTLRRLERDRVFVPIEMDSRETESAVPPSLIAEGDPLGDLTRNEMIEAVRSAVLALPAHYREVVLLCDLHEMSYAEAADVVGCAVGTVRSRLHRARALLVEKLKASNNAKPASRAISPVSCIV